MFRYLLLFATGMLLGVTVSANPDADQDAVTAAVSDVCSAKLVFLGEASHGSAVAVELKSRLVEGLIRQCGFNHIAFESSAYDFVDLKQKYINRSARKSDLYNAIGGVWSTAAELDKLVELLHGQAQEGRLSLSGIDPQFGGATSQYGRDGLGKRLTAYLDERMKPICADAISRFSAWTFDDANPYDDAFKQKMQQCAERIGLSAAAVHADPQFIWMAVSFSGLYGHSVDSENVNLRDRLMHANLRSILALLPQGTKTIVWTANAHSWREPLAGYSSVAAHFVAEEHEAELVRSLAIVASSGTYGRKAVTIGEASAQSLEAHALRETASSYVYLNKISLGKLDGLESRLEGYDRYGVEAWSRLLDGVIVARTDHPLTNVRPLRPIQDPEN